MLSKAIKYGLFTGATCYYYDQLNPSAQKTVLVTAAAAGAATCVVISLSTAFIAGAIWALRVPLELGIHIIGEYIK